MATMKLYELVNHYHIGTELTCAEAMFMACNEYYHLNLSEETRKMFSVMGLGMQTEHSCCGAFTVAVGIIGLMTAKEGQTDVSNMEGYQMIAELTDFMLGFYGTLHCVELQKLEIVGVENPCHAIVEALAKKLEELLAGRRIFPVDKWGTAQFLICWKGREDMKDFSQYGNRPDDQWEMLPWIPDPRPPFKIWVKPEQIAPFFLIPHHPYAISLLLKISDGFRTEEFCRLGLTGSSGDWERLVRGVIREFEEGNSGEDLFDFDSDEDVFCVYSQYIDDLMMLAKMIRAACADEKTMGMYLNMSEAAKA